MTQTRIVLLLPFDRPAAEERGLGCPGPPSVRLPIEQQGKPRFSTAPSDIHESLPASYVQTRKRPAGFYIRSLPIELSREQAEELALVELLQLHQILFRCRTSLKTSEIQKRSVSTLAEYIGRWRRFDQSRASSALYKREMMYMASRQRKPLKPLNRRFWGR
jgi:hypothetical protein